MVLFLITSLAVWRFTYMLQTEEGPFSIFLRLQAYIASLEPRHPSLYRGFNCFYCLSVWVSLLPALLIAWASPIFLAYWLGLSGGAILINKIINQ